MLFKKGSVSIKKNLLKLQLVFFPVILIIIIYYLLYDCSGSDLLKLKEVFSKNEMVAGS